MKKALRYKNIAALVLSIFAASLVAAQQDDWRAKNIDQWTKADIESVLNNSAWVKRQEVRVRFRGELRAVAGAGNSAETIEARREVLSGGNAPIDFEFTLRLRSALPIRLALVRQAQLNANYDKLNKEERAALDKKLKGLYECPACADNYVLTLSSRSKSYPGADAVFTSLKGAKLAELKRYFYLSNDRGEKRELVHFTPPKAPGDEAYFFFRRLDEKGQPLFTPNDKELVFRLNTEELNVPTNFTIDVSKLLVNGQVIF
ncbi:MAG TPA: hypothetical protein VF791_21245 [Pyrinomonadaceae bacterium]